MVQRRANLPELLGPEQGPLESDPGSYFTLLNLVGGGQRLNGEGPLSLEIRESERRESEEDGGLGRKQRNGVRLGLPGVSGKSQEQRLHLWDLCCSQAKATKRPKVSNGNWWLFSLYIEPRGHLCSLRHDPGEGRRRISFPEDPKRLLNFVPEVGKVKHRRGRLSFIRPRPFPGAVRA